MLFQKEHINLTESQNHLNIECGFGLLKAVVLSADKTSVLYAALDVSDNVTEFIEKHKLNKLESKSVVVSFVNQYSTLIPNSIFDAKGLNNYLDFSFEEIEDTVSGFDKLSTLEANNCYLYISRLKNEFIKAFPNADFMHQSTGIIELNRTANPLILVEFFPTHFQLMHVADNMFKLFNSFQYETAADLIYFLTYALDQLKISKTASIELSGYLKGHKNTVLQLKEFFPNITIRTNVTVLNMDIVPKAKQSAFLQVTRQHLCV